MRRFLIAFLLVAALGQAQSIKYTPAGAGGITGLSSDGSKITSTLPLVLPAGAAGVGNSALRFTGTPMGFYESGNALYVSYNGSPASIIGPNLSIRSTDRVIWASGSTPGIGNDLYLERESTGILQLGVDVNGAAVAQTVKSHDGITGTDIAGADLILAGGRGTGAGTPGKIILQTSPTVGSGTTAQGLTTKITVDANVNISTNIAPSGDDLYHNGLASNRYWTYTGTSRSFVGSKSKSLTDAAGAASFTRISVAAATFAGGELIWTATSTDGTDHRTLQGRMRFAFTNKAGTEDCNDVAAVGTDLLSSTNANTLVCTWTGANVAADTCDLQVTCTDNTGGNQTITMYGRLDMPIYNAVTPQ